MAESIVADWRDLPGFPGYQVSSTGLVRSVDRSIVVERRPGWFVPRTYKGRILRPRINKQGYKSFIAHYQTVSIHHAVLLAFVGPRPPGMYACHNDGDRLNNCLSNLRWATPKENSADAAAHGTQVRGETNGSARLDRRAVLLVRALGPHCTASRIGGLLGVKAATVSDILNGKTWKHV